MPDKAQREISATVVSLVAWEFERRVSGSTHEDASRRLVNWRSVCDPNAGRWVIAVPWDRHGHMNVSAWMMQSSSPMELSGRSPTKFVS
eukprot:COSAG02_NODE_1310_length_13323_cov_17.158878_3_plen_89_part_00